MSESTTAAPDALPEAPPNAREVQLLERVIWAIKFCKLRPGQTVFIQNESGMRSVDFETWMAEALLPYGITVDVPTLCADKYGKKKGNKKRE